MKCACGKEAPGIRDCTYVINNQAFCSKACYKGKLISLLQQLENTKEEVKESLVFHK